MRWDDKTSLHGLMQVLSDELGRLPQFLFSILPVAWTPLDGGLHSCGNHHVLHCAFGSLLTISPEIVQCCLLSHSRTYETIENFSRVVCCVARLLMFLFECLFITFRPISIARAFGEVCIYFDCCTRSRSEELLSCTSWDFQKSTAWVELLGPL